MGAFFLARRSGDDASGRKQRAIEALREQGFGRITDLSNAGFDLLYCAKRHVAEDSVYRLDPDNFCLSTGTLIYRQTLGAQAARLLFEDWSGNRLDRTQLFGNFALVVCVDGLPWVHNDPQGVYNIWHDRSLDCLSSSFPAMFATSPRLTLNPDAVYPYVFQEATFGGDTVFSQIGRLLVGRGVRLDRSAGLVPGLAQPAQDVDVAADIGRHVALLHEQLGRQFAAIKACFGDHVDSALSGGYDSRLLLALCREQGISPHLHVYGAADAADVRVATAICQGEGIPLSHEDKSRHARVEPDRFAGIVAQNFHAFQGLCADGILDNGADLHTRLARTRDGGLLLNGGGGEVLRNFFYLPDRRYRARELLWAFYSRFDPAVCSERFSAEAYYRHFEEQIAQQLGRQGRLDRATLEYLYAGFRCTYWMGQNNAINNQFGWFLTPFVEHALAQYAHAIPIALKNQGRLEAALIRAVSPSLAGYASDYGHDFSGPIPLKRRLSGALTLARPTWLRRYTYRWKRYSRDHWPYFLGPEYIERILPEGFPYLGRYFQIDKVADAQQFRRICSLEYLLQRTAAAA